MLTFFLYLVFNPYISAIYLLPDAYSNDNFDNYYQFKFENTFSRVNPALGIYAEIIHGQNNYMADDYFIGSGNNVSLIAGAIGMQTVFFINEYMDAAFNFGYYHGKICYPVARDSGIIDYTSDTRRSVGFETTVTVFHKINNFRIGMRWHGSIVPFAARAEPVDHYYGPIRYSLSYVNLNSFGVGITFNFYKEEK
ncbi:hypothetical protein A2Y85_04810 [candidate division WOR-3 bacterium RBG_13_43_14]|uniref:Uncharacterized protein n=1 Tax=candidate division WOR-3 bacterium RBG_13_43_14 TaxID=1802590 RepID=A0A1F4UC82_UNCW3|nr:MAG: hypothetical protein A2Y85_04810 [candidate division WOR-3 bacterium RBG_13_43_14]